MPPVQSTKPRQVKMSSTMAEICDKEILDLLAKGAAVKIPPFKYGFVSNVFAIPKSSGGFRPVINLKYLNEFIRYESSHMEGIQSLRHLVRPHDWLAKLDLKDAFNNGGTFCQAIVH